MTFFRSPSGDGLLPSFSLLRNFYYRLPSKCSSNHSRKRKTSSFRRRQTTMLQRDETSRVFRSLPAWSVVRKFEFSACVIPIVDLFQITKFNFQRQLLMAICFFFFLCLQSHAFVRASSLRKLACTEPSKVPCPNIGLAAMITENWSQRAFSTLAFDINSNAVHTKFIRWCEYLDSSNVRK